MPPLENMLASRKRLAPALALLIALAALAVGAAGVAYAYFTATVASGGNGGAVSGSLPQGSTPEVSLSGANVTVSWAQSSVAGQRLGAYAGGGYTLKRYPASGGSGVSPGTSCNTTLSGSTSTLSCTESNVPPGSWKYAVTPVLNNWVGAESAQSATVTVIGPPAKVAVQSGSPQSATVNTAFASALVALVTDVNGNPVPGVSVTFTAPSSGASGTFANATTTTATTASNGQATASAFTANTIAGGYAVSASVSGVSAAASFALNNNPGAASRLAFTPSTPGPGIAGESIPNVAVSVEDSFGNVVSSQGSGSVSISIKAGSAQGSFASGTTTASVSKGVASFTNLVVDTSGSYTFTATPSSIGGVTSAVNSNAFTVNPAAASKLAFTTEPIGTATRSVAFATQPVVTVEDAFGNRVPTDSSSVMLTLNNPGKVSGASLTCTVNPLTASGGVASFGGCKINKDGTFSLHAADSTLTALDSTSIAVSG